MEIQGLHISSNTKQKKTPMNYRTQQNKIEEPIQNSKQEMHLNEIKKKATALD
jgi:hypothetical protein